MNTFLKVKGINLIVWNRELDFIWSNSEMHISERRLSWDCAFPLHLSILVDYLIKITSFELIILRT
jgi:hypothetical protein